MNWNEIPGWFDQANYDAFAELELPKNPVVLESGTYHGRSTQVIAELFPDAEIHTCDPINCDPTLPDNATYYNTKTVDLDWDKPIDLLFIDNSHLYTDIKEDYDKYEPFVKSGGYIVFHDYHFQGGGADGVREFVDEIGGCDINAGGEFGLAIRRKP